jgi:hypothetical protein
MTCSRYFTMTQLVQAHPHLHFLRQPTPHIADAIAMLDSW